MLPPEVIASTAPTVFLSLIDPPEDLSLTSSFPPSSVMVPPDVLACTFGTPIQSDTPAWSIDAQIALNGFTMHRPTSGLDPNLILPRKLQPEVDAHLLEALVFTGPAPDDSDSTFMARDVYLETSDGLSFGRVTEFTLNFDSQSFGLGSHKGYPPNFGLEIKLTDIVNLEFVYFLVFGHLLSPLSGSGSSHW